MGICKVLHLVLLQSGACRLPRIRRPSRLDTILVRFEDKVAMRLRAVSSVGFPLQRCLQSVVLNRGATLGDCTVLSHYSLFSWSTICRPMLRFHRRFPVFE